MNKVLRKSIDMQKYLIASIEYKRMKMKKFTNIKREKE